jgi:hypothetical protein
MTDSYDGATKTTSYTLTVAVAMAAATGQQQSYTTRIGDSFASSAPSFDNTVGTVTYTQTGKPSALSFNASTGVLSGTPTATGTFTIVVTAKDSTGRTATFTYTLSIKAAFTLTVTPIVLFSDDPTATGTSPATVAGAVGTLTFDYQNLPSGLSFDPSTGAISGTVTSGEGVYTATASVNDSFGNKTVSQSLKINVAAREHTYWRVVIPSFETTELFAYDLSGSAIAVSGGGWLTDGNTTTGVVSSGAKNFTTTDPAAVRKVTVRGYNSVTPAFVVYFSDDATTYYKVPGQTYSKSGILGTMSW